ncbi:type II toxin-antitoxin system HicB family antitoxin [Candidatus Parcubacteria bacterium]|nr:MAG: type II toxin-antitoxin system HicB family antitoxin [Candidatus Parcubacteria bacterium]
MIPDGYRVLICYDSESEDFVAYVPELEGIKVHGKDRAEVVQKVEEQIEQAIKTAADNDQKLPEPVDGREFDGKIELSVTPSLHRELEFQARAEGTDLGALCGELLAAALELRRARARQSQQQSNVQNHSDSRRKGGRRGRGGRDYFAIMDDKASFLEYVRSLETNPARGGGGRRRGGRGGK